MPKRTKINESKGKRNPDHYAANTILLIDDDKTFRAEFCDCFDEYDVVEAQNAREALKILRRPHEIDLIILDVMLPDARGTELLFDIRQKNPDISIIILTAHSSKDVAVEALRGRADDYIEKPFDVLKAKEIIEKVLEKNNQVAASDAGDISGKIERVKRYIQRNCHKKICLHDAATAVFLSPKYLSRIFKHYTGEGFSEYRLRIKTEKAQTLLQERLYNINQIAERLGYENTESFIRIFSKITGQTPTEYRKRKKPAGVAGKRAHRKRRRH